MFQNLIQQALSFIARIGSDPNDDDDIRLQKSLLVMSAFPFMVAGAAWGLIYLGSNEPLAGSIPLSYSLISLLSIIHFGQTRQYRFFRFSQLTLILLLPFFLMVALGGFINGSAVILWSLLCPLGALLFDEPRQAPRWFLDSPQMRRLGPVFLRQLAEGPGEQLLTGAFADPDLITAEIREKHARTTSVAPRVPARGRRPCR